MGQGQMVSAGNNDGLAKKDRRDAAREKARQDRESERKRQRRNRFFWQGGAGLAVIAIAAIVVLVVTNAPKPAGLSDSTAGPANMISDGILLTGPDLAAVPTAAIKAGGKPVPTDEAKYPNTVNIVTYVDYQCPACQAFEQTNSAQIQQWVASGMATIEIHPVAILDASSEGNMYSTRAGNAAACVANYDPDDYYAVSTAFYANQPAEDTDGATNAQILAVLKGAGASSSEITNCVNTQQFSAWETAATNRVLNGPLPNSSITKLEHTPTVVVNGKEYTGSITDAAAFATFVEAQATTK
jgi:protein-disulfide isomerase